MNLRHSGPRARAAYLAALLGTSSFSIIEAAMAADAAPAAPVEEVLITGSLITGAPAIGLPVTTLGEESFTESGSLNITEMLETMTVFDIPPVVGPVEGGGTLHFASSVNIHNVGEGDTLMMLDGKRWPLAGYDGLRVDPSIFPQIAVQRTDVLTAGASATYGADAAAGVINVILKRGYNGAQTNIRFGTAFADDGSGDLIHENAMFSQLWGRTWASGGITIAYEIQRENYVPGDALPWNTLNFGESGFGGLDFTPIAAYVPGVVSTGRTRAPSGVTVPTRFTPDRFGGVYCGNCFSLPTGIGWNFGTQDPGPTTTWAAIVARKGIQEDIKHNPWHDGWALPEMDHNAITATFDQEIVSNVDLMGMTIGTISLQVDGFYSNKRYKQVFPTDHGQGVENMSPIRDGYVVPTNNPYRPTGVPAGTDLRIHFNLGPELDTPMIAGGQTNARWLVGLNFDELPFDWNGKIHYSQTDNFSYGFDRGGIIPNMVIAALGNTVASIAAAGEVPAVGPFTKPAGIPYLNPFCDMLQFKCQSPQTIAYISGFRDQSLRTHLTEINAQIDGPIPGFELPAGPIFVALGFSRINNAQDVEQIDNTNSHMKSQIVHTGDNLYEVNNAIIGQMNIPVFGDDFAFPFFERLDVELGYRRDAYQTLPEAVYTPKVAVNWIVGWGLSFQGSWGKSFRTPKGEEIFSSGSGVSALNLLGGLENQNTTELLCENEGLDAPRGVAIPGSLTAELNPTCAGRGAGFPADPTGLLSAPAIISLSGSPVLVAPILAASPLTAGSDFGQIGPQNATQYNIGFNLAPTADVFGGVFSGLDLTATYWHLRYRDLIAGIGEGEGPDDPLSRPYFIAITNPNAPITDPSNADFFQLVRDLSAVPTRTSRAPGPEHMLNVRAIEISLTGNVGLREMSGIDFNFRWDWDTGNWGTFNIGASGSYILKDRSKGSITDENWSVNYGDYGPDDDVSRATGHQMRKVRYRAGWTDGTWTATAFFNHFFHGGQNPNAEGLVPPCFWQPQFGPGSCYPGSPYHGPFEDHFPFVTPANVLVDLNLGYQTGDHWANPYLQNISFSFTVLNLLDKKPPLGVHPLRSRGTGVVAYDRQYSPLTREISFSISKLW
jgi:outer membrane receptor protein involved in Fe transport